MKFLALLLLINLPIYAQFPPKPGGGGLPGPGGAPKPPNIKKTKIDLSSQVKKVLTSNMKQMSNLEKQFSGMKKKLLEGNQKQLTQLLDITKKAGNRELTQLLSKNLKMISSQLLNLNSGTSSSSSSSSDTNDSDEETDDEADDEETDDENTEESEKTAKSSGESENKDFSLGRWYQTKTHFTLQSGGEGIDSNGDRFSWIQKDKKITIQYPNKVVRVYIDVNKREILGLDRKRTRGVYEEN